MQAQTLVLVRHAQGHHQAPPDTSIRDADLTPHGISEAEHLRDTFPHHALVDLLAASPLRRAIRTALTAFSPTQLPVLAVSTAQEGSGDPSDMGSDIEEIRALFGDAVDYSLLSSAWYTKSGANGSDVAALQARARALRRWLRDRPERFIVLVSHGYFAHFLTGNVDENGSQTGEWWDNARWRCFNFDSGEEARLIETGESLSRTASDEGVNPAQG